MERINIVKVGWSKIMKALECWEGIGIMFGDNRNSLKSLNQGQKSKRCDICEVVFQKG